MKQLIGAILLLFICQSFGQSYEPNEELLVDSSNIESLDEKINMLVDSIKRLEGERNYFETALNSQTVIFSIILSFILFLFGTVSYINFKLEVRRNEKLFNSNLSKLEKSFSKLEQDFSVKNNLFYQNNGRLSMVVAETIFKDKLTQKLSQYLVAVEFYFNSEGKNKNQSIRTILKQCTKITEDILKNDSERQVFINHDHNKDIERLKTILKLNDKEIVNQTIKLLYLLTNKE